MNNPVLCDICGNHFAPKESLSLQCPTCMLMGAFPDIAKASERASGSLGLAGFEPPSIDVLQPYFSEYELLSLAGRGGMSAVYKARQTNLDRIVAIKILPVEVAESLGGFERFQREAKALAQVSHPNIVAIHSFGEAGQWCYFVMEFVEGCSLRQVIGSGDLASSDVLRMVESICTALQYAHDKGFVHRDIKPENVLLDRDGEIKIVDFGLAKPLCSGDLYTRATGTNQVLGTPHYLAPEQVRTPSKVDHRADLYSLGVVIYEMLTGELPIGNFDPPSKKTKREPGWDRIVMRALSTDPARRYSHASELREALSSCGDVPMEPVTAATAPEPTSMNADASWLVVIAMIGLLLGAAYFLDEGLRNLRPDMNGSTHVDWAFHQIGRSFLCFIGAMMIAGGNLRPVTGTEVPSAPQRILSSFTKSCYWLVSLIVVLFPAFLILLYASIPLLSDKERMYWDLFGYNFKFQSGQVGDKYWLAAFGSAATGSAIWSTLIFLILYFFARPSERLLQPLSRESVRALRLAIILFAIFCLAPLGGVLLWAADQR